MELKSEEINENLKKYQQKIDSWDDVDIVKKLILWNVSLKCGQLSIKND